MRRTLSCLLAAVVALLVTGFARPAAAQDIPKAEVSAGYSWLTAKTPGDANWDNFKKGFYVDVAGSVSDTLSIVGQYTGHFKDFGDADDPERLRIDTFMAGVRGSSSGRFRGFGQVLIGGAKFSLTDFDVSETDLAIQIGGGLTVLGTSRVGLRFGLDYLRFLAKDDAPILEFGDVNAFRFSLGVTFGLSTR